MSDLPPSSRTNNQRLLLALLASAPGSPAGHPEGIQWDDFLRLAGGLGLAPFLAYLAQQQPCGFPEPVKKQLLEAGRANAWRQLRRHAALRRIAGFLDQAHIPFLVLKGMALAYIAYPDPYCRSMSDLDLLVPRAHLSGADQAARDSGLVESRLNFRQDCPAFASADRVVHVELHGSIPSFEYFGVDGGTLWERSVAADLGGIQARVLCPEDFVQHLCLHIGPHHNYLSRLQALLDFRFYLEKYGAETDWQAVSTRSQQIGSAAWVYLTLWLARELVGAPVPAAFFHSCSAPQRLDELCGIATQHLLFCSDLPMNSSFVRAFSGGSFKKRLGALAEHWKAVGSQVEDNAGPREAAQLGKGAYLRLFLRRVRFMIRSGALRPSAWNGAAEYQASRAHLLNLMGREAQLPPGEPRAI